MHLGDVPGGSTKFQAWSSLWEAVGANCPTFRGAPAKLGSLKLGRKVGQMDWVLVGSQREERCASVFIGGVGQSRSMPPPALAAEAAMPRREGGGGDAAAGGDAGAQRDRVHGREHDELEQLCGDRARRVW